MRRIAREDKTGLKVIRRKGSEKYKTIVEKKDEKVKEIIR